MKNIKCPHCGSQGYASRELDIVYFRCPTCGFYTLLKNLQRVVKEVKELKEKEEK